MSATQIYKNITVRQDPVMSLEEAGLFELQISRRDQPVRALFLANLMIPNEHRGIFDLITQLCLDYKPHIIGFLGASFDELPFKQLGENDSELIHRLPDPVEVRKARQSSRYIDRQFAELARLCGLRVKELLQAGDSMGILIPSLTHLSLANEGRLMEYIHQRKRFMDGWGESHPKARRLPSDLDFELPTDIDKLFGLQWSQELQANTKHGEQLARIQVLPYNAGLVWGSYREGKHGPVLVKEASTLFTVGISRRRNQGDSAWLHLVESGFRRLVMGFDGRVSYAAETVTENTLPQQRVITREAWSCGRLWSRATNGRFNDDKHRRAAGFVIGELLPDGDFAGTTVVIERDDKGRRSFIVDFDGDVHLYKEKTPSELAHGKPITIPARR